MFFPSSAGPALPPRVRTFFWLSIVFLLLTVSRWMLAPRFLYYFDSINFALSMDHFDPWHHQPQPPGYPLFVGALRVVGLAFRDPQHVLVATGLLIAFAALLLSRRLSAEMFAPRAGVLTAALLLFNPPFWLSGVTNQVRLCLAMCSAGVALLAWRALQRRESGVWLWLAFAALGLAAGFRPADCALLVPLLLWVWFSTGASVSRLAIGIGCMIAAALPWMAVTAWAVGGVPRWIFLMWTYGRDQFRGTSLLFGAEAAPALDMALKAVVWTGIGLIAWIWAIPFLRSRQNEPGDRSRTLFLVAWILPPFVFSMLIHIGDPDQALTTIVGLCVVGGAVLHRLAERFRLTRAAPLALLAAAGSGVFFFVPLGTVAQASTWEVVRSTDERLQTTFDAIRAVHGDRPAAIIHYGAEVTWRHIFYYFPSDYLLYLPKDAGELPMSFHQRKLVKEGPEATRLPQVRRVILVAPHLNGGWMAEHGWQVRGQVYWRDLSDNRPLSIGNWQIQRTM